MVLSGCPEKPSQVLNVPMADLIAALETLLGNPRKGLPKEIFLLVSRLTPMVNVDLLIKNERNETLLTWREDEYYGPGWHVPGGIVRFKESLANRIQAVAESELGAMVEHEAEPMTINETMNTMRDTRGHFISLLYKCRLLRSPDPGMAYRGGVAKNGQWAWHAGAPQELIPVHGIYKIYLS